MRIGYFFALTLIALAALLTPTGAVWAQPCLNSPDINGGGRVDACDMLLLAHDMGTNHLRSDFDCNGQVNLNDISLFSQSVCYADPSPPPPPSAAQGAATIGVYFDAAGTITAQSNVAPFTLLDFYVVAHGVPEDVERYLFRLAVSGGWTGPPGMTSVDWPAGVTGSVDPGIGDHDNYLIGFDGSCLSPASDTVVLAHFTDFYLGGANATYEVVSPDLTGASCMAPSDQPSYGPCGSGCGWTYFAPDSNRGGRGEPRSPRPLRRL